MKAKHILLGLLGLSIITIGCKKKDDPVIPNEEELITTMIFTLISQDQTDTAVMRFEDLDGEGGNAPIIIGGSLKKGTIYNGTLLILNEQKNPAEDITLEVIAEAEEHQFFYETLGGLDLSIAYADTDQNGNPIGVNSIITTNAVSNGQLKVILRHEPDKFATGVAGGDITNAGGETDIQVSFNVDIQ
jgi:hypothetical protein